MHQVNQQIAQALPLAVTASSGDDDRTMLVINGVESVNIPFDIHTAVELSAHQERLRIAQERRRQAACSFNLTLVMTAACAIVSLLGAGLLLSGKVEKGVVTTATGVASSIYCWRFAKDANDRLDRIMTSLSSENEQNI